MRAQIAQEADKCRSPLWKPSAFAFSVERRIIGQDMVSVSLQHPTWPYIEKLDLPAERFRP